jgi:ribosomal protein L7Ae-like RNA K-turn-binding protein
VQNKFLQFLGLAKKSGNLIEGYNKCEELVKRSGLYLLILSTDCSTNTKEKFVKYCMNYNIPFIESFSKEELGAPIGRAEISILGVANKRISDKLLSLWNEQSNTNIRG